MDIIALLAALLAFGYAFLAQRKLRELGERLSRATSNLYTLSSQLEELRQQMDTQSQELRFEIKKAAGQVKIEPTTTIADLQAVHPFADSILASFHMGGCQSCAVDPGETLAAACARLNVNPSDLLAALRSESAPPRLASIELM